MAVLGGSGLPAEALSHDGEAVPRVAAKVPEFDALVVLDQPGVGGRGPTAARG